MAYFRTVVVNKCAKLEYKLGYLIIRSDKEERVHITEIDNLIIESTATAVTSMLISELSKQGVNVIFCNEKHLPECYLTSFYGHTSVSKNVVLQFKWDEQVKAKIWAEIVKLKIQIQAKNLIESQKPKESSMLRNYADEVKDDDITNREGHSAKVYFNALFTEGFARSKDHIINSALNYGYAFLLSLFAREIVAAGYVTELGIWHHNEFNQYNLASDLMEPFRPIVDWMVVNASEDNINNFRTYLQKLFLVKIKINDENQYITSAIRIWLRKVFNSLNNGESEIYKFDEFWIEEEEE